MAIIRNTIVLDDQMSIALRDIISTTKEMQNMVCEATKNFDGWSESLELAKIYTDDMSEAMKAAKDVYETTKNSIYGIKVSMDYASESAKEYQLIAEDIKTVTEQIPPFVYEVVHEISNMNAELEQTAVGVENVNQQTGRAARGGVQQLARSGANVLRYFGPIPSTIGNMTAAVTGLTGAMRTTLPVAAKLAATIAPITLIAGGIMALVGIFQSFRRDADDVALSLDELNVRQSTLASESERLSGYLQESVYWYNRLNDAGASEGLLNSLRYRSETQEILARHFEVQAGFALSDAYAEAFAQAQEQTRHSNVVTHYEIDRIMGDNGWYEEYRAIYGRIYETSAETLARLMAHSERYGVITDEVFSKMNEHAASVAENMTNLYTSLDPLHQEYVQNSRELLSQHLDMIEYFGRLPAVISDYEQEMNDLTQAITAQDQASANTRNHILRSYRDIYAAAESLRGNHYALSHAINGTTSEYMSQLDAFNQIMRMSPEYLNFLFNEYGALMDVEHAVYEVTQAQMELLMYRQKNAFLDTVVMWGEEGRVLGVVASAVDNLADSYQYLANSRMLALAGAIGDTITQEDFDRINNIMETLGTIGTSARSGVRERGVFRHDGALLVSDPANNEIRGEILRLKEDVSRRAFAVGAYRQNTPVVIQPANNTYNIYPSAGMDEEQLAKKVSSYVAQDVADLMEEAYKNDLRSGY